ncbi:MAG TPA: hypothetical protein EYP63_05490 [Desulfotomaculum sp.]|nr:hypothetical protein [Desulfotomaculum sp.]
MEQFRQYIGKTLDVSKVKDEGLLAGYGLKGRYIPDPPEEFDEFEFTTDFAGQTVVLLVTVEKGAVKRMLLSYADPEDPDELRTMSETELQEFLSHKGGKLTGFFDQITG